MPKKDPAPSSLEIHLLGPFKTIVDGEVVADVCWQRRKPKLLVKLLALQPQHRLHREQIMDLLWPEQDFESAANSLNKIIYLARRALEPELTSGSGSRFIVTKSQQVGLQTDLLRVDADEFTELGQDALRTTDPKNYEAALSLYQDDLLPEDLYQDWTTIRREQLRTLHRKLVLKLARLNGTEGVYGQTIERLKELVTRDALDEEAHRELMRLYALTGNKFQSLEQYKRCREALRKHLDVDPDPETIELGKQIIHGHLQPPALKINESKPPVFTQITFRRGTIRSAKISKDGSRVIVAAAWEGHPAELYLLQNESRESHPLGFVNAGILAISSTGEMAISLRRRFIIGYINSGTLAKTAIDGGALEELHDDIQWADWSPDGESLLVVRDAGGRNRLEFPIGKTLYETNGWISHPRISPDGQTIAFIDHPVQADDSGSISIMDLAGKRRVLATGWISAQGLAWGATGEEIWFTATDKGSARALYSVSLDGKQRLIIRMAGTLTLHDISQTGRVLISRDNTRLGMSGLPPGDDQERDLSWLDWSVGRDLSSDGTHLLFTEAGEGEGARYGAYIRRTDVAETIRLGEGSALALSPDGRWALTIRRGELSQLVLLPVGEGEPRLLERAELNYQPWGCWFPDGKKVLFVGAEKGRGSLLYVQRIDGGKPRTLNPQIEGVILSSPHVISPNGQTVAAVDQNRRVCFFSLKGKGCVDYPGLTIGDVPIRWNADASSLYVFRRDQLPLRIYLVDLRTGHRELWKELMPSDPVGVHEILRVLITPDTSAYVYTYTRDLSELYLAEDLS
jgi:DNA-binding SARP family transcriptional activator/Tol biopolymer transport system component